MIEKEYSTECKLDNVHGLLEAWLSSIGFAVAFAKKEKDSCELFAISKGQRAVGEVNAIQVSLSREEGKTTARIVVAVEGKDLLVRLDDGFAIVENGVGKALDSMKPMIMNTRPLLSMTKLTAYRFQREVLNLLERAI